MGILYDKVTELEDEKRRLEQRLEFFNVPSPGRDRIQKRAYEVGNELEYIRRHPEAAQNMNGGCA